MLRTEFQFGKFAEPARESLISDTESQLGVRLPNQLRNLYLECDGFREDRGNAKYLLSLQDEDHIGSLLSMTRFYWTEFADTWPNLDLKPFVFFGSSSGDEAWGIQWQGEQKIIAFHHHMEGEYEVVGSNIIEVYRADYRRYDEVGEA